MLRVGALCITVGLTGSSAFQLSPPAQTVGRSTSSALGVSLDGKAGSSAPFEAWDPMGLSTSADEATFSKWREAELKHCRLGMMAAAGILAGETAPFLLGKDVSGPAFGHMAQVPQWASVFPVATMIAAEASNIKVDDKGNFQYCGGKYNWDPARLFSKMSTKQQEAMETRELNNGRLAMIATIGILFQEGYFKESAIQQLLAVTGTA